MNNKSLALTCIAHLMSIQSFLVYVSVFCAKPNRELTDAFATKQHEIVLIVRFHSFLLLFRVSLKTKIQLACPHTNVILTHTLSQTLASLSQSQSLPTVFNRNITNNKQNMFAKSRVEGEKTGGFFSFIDWGTTMTDF